LELPALRERGEDLLTLAQSILKRLGDRYGIEVKLGFQSQKELMEYSWPGNVRELENVLERSLVMSSGEEFKLSLPVQNLIKVESQPRKSEVISTKIEPTSPLSLADERAKNEKHTIEIELEKNRWNRTRTAEALGVSRRTLLYKIKAYGIV
jgi:DNA-binding NtrC family response regulator